jgi:hypothetical protein
MKPGVAVTWCLPSRGQYPEDLLVQIAAAPTSGSVGQLLSFTLSTMLLICLAPWTGGGRAITAQLSSAQLRLGTLQVKAPSARFSLRPGSLELPKRVGTLRPVNVEHGRAGTLQYIDSSISKDRHLYR